MEEPKSNNIIKDLSLDAWAFAEWTGEHYIRMHECWVPRFADQRDKSNWIDTADLWKLWYENYRTSLEYVRKQRGLDFIERGMRVELSYGSVKKQGTIMGGNPSGNIDVLFDGEKTHANCHPTWCLKYFDKQGNVIAEYASH